MRLRGTWLAPLADAVIAAAAVLVSYRLRFDPEVLPTFQFAAFRAAPIAAVLVPLCGWALGTYAWPSRHLWPVRLMLAAAMGMGGTAAVMWGTGNFEGVSRFGLVAAALLSVMGAGAWRAAEGLRGQLAQARAAQVGAAYDVLGASAPSLGLGLLRLFGYRELIRNLALKDLKLKYRGSALGFLWSLGNPVVMLAVYWVAFTAIMGVSRPAFPYFLMIGMLAWTFFAGTAMMATGAIVDSAGLLKSVRFPRAVLPAATVLFNLTQYLMIFLVLLPVMLAVFRVPPSPAMLAFPLVLLLLVCFTTGVALVVSAATAFFRDVRHLVEVALAVLFWLTPIVYDLGDVPERLRLVILLSPVSPFVSALHDIFYAGVWPDASIWIAAVAWSLAMLVSGVSVFLSLENRLAEQV